MFERRLYKGLWVAGGIEFLGRHQKYVFDMDTLAAYPPVSHPPAGLHFSKIVDYWYGLELPVMFEYRIGLVNYCRPHNVQAITYERSC